MSRLPALAAILALAAVLAGGASAALRRAGLTVFAGSSMTEVLPEDRLREHVLVREHRHARDADHERRARRRLDVARTRRPAHRSTPRARSLKPVNFTRNTLAVVVPKSNPAGHQDRSTT